MNPSVNAMDTDRRYERFLGSLPPIELMTEIKDEVDTYGIRQYIAGKIGRRVDGRSFNSWRHGWSPYRGVRYPEQIVGRCGFCFNHLVIDDGQKEALERLGRRNVHAVGLPFIYIDEPAPERIPDSLLFMPSHGQTRRAKGGELEDIQLRNLNDRAIFDYALALRDRFKFVVICLHGSDYRQMQPLIDAYRKQGVYTVLGATGLDRNALVRMHRLFHSFEYVTSNGIGSQLVYGNLCGCKTTIAGDYLEYEKEDFVGLREIEARPEIRDDMIAFYREKNMRQVLGFLFADDPREGRVHTAWAAEQAGLAHRRSYEEICELLDCGWPRQVIGYCGRACNKLERLLSRRNGHGND